MTEIFFIAYQFPPLNVGGAFRPLKFVTYFNVFGIKPVVFTLTTEDYHKVYKGKKPDYNLLNDIKDANCEIVKVKTDDLLANQRNKLKTFTQIYFNVSGMEHKKWKSNFFEATERALNKHKPKVILVTAPPFGVVELAVKLSKKTGIPLIIDMRDSLSMWVSQPYGSYFHYIFTLRKEKRWFKHAKKVITVTQQVVNDWKSVHKNIPKSKYVVIPNGFDKDITFSDIIVSPVRETFTIGYVGSFYYNPESRKSLFTPWYKKRLHRKLQYTPRKEDWLYRSPYFLFKTLNLLFEKHPELKPKIIIKFAGLKPDWLDEMTKKFDLFENVKSVGFLPFDKIEKFQQKCDALLVTSVKVIGGEDYCIAGKTFDYIAMQKPILGFVTEGAQKQFIENAGVGIVCNPDDCEESANVLRNIFEKGITLKPNKEFIEKHHRRHLTKQLSEIIHAL